MATYLSNTAQEKLLVYQLTLKELDTRTPLQKILDYSDDLNLKLYPVFVWAPLLKDFLSKNAEQITKGAFMRGWIDPKETLNSLLLNQENKVPETVQDGMGLLRKLPQQSTQLAANKIAYDPMSFFIGYPEDFENIPKDIILFSPDNYGICYPTDCHTLYTEELYLNYQRNVLYKMLDQHYRVNPHAQPARKRTPSPH